MPPIQHNRLLLVDDDPLFGNFMRRKAARLGICLDHASALVDAVYTGRPLKAYDAAIIDCVMPKMDGFETAAYLATFFQDMPLVMISGSSFSFERFLADPSLAQAFVAKTQGVDAVLAAACHVGGIACAPGSSLPAPLVKTGEEYRSWNR